MHHKWWANFPTWLKTGVSWYAGKTAIVRDAIGQYLAQPIYPLNSTA
jgi:hypothetical protein